ncbi:MAG TPA: glycosyltransferase [Sphingobium sp.]
MRIVHITAHLGGGVGKAHGALCAQDGPDVERHYLLLEPPRDTRYVDAIRAAGATVDVVQDAAHVQRRVAGADIVQIEWWNHPRLYECLSRFDLPASRTILWSHISGLFAPFIPAGLLTAPHRFLFTSPCSLDAPSVQALTPQDRARLGVINSGFGFEAARAPDTGARDVAYLGTVDFSKLSPDFFAVVDRAGLDRPVSIWGAVDADSEVLARAAAMERPDAVRFRGHADDPQAALRGVGLFLYLLQPHHFGTAENALIEAMSLGCVPLVFANPAECAIVDHGRTGFIESSVDAAAERLRWMVEHPAELRAIARNAVEAVSVTHSARQSADDFAALYRSLLRTEKRTLDYPALLGTTPADWFLSTQGETVATAQPGAARKGSLAHFLQCFPDDNALRDLAGERLSSARTG